MLSSMYGINQSMATTMALKQSTIHHHQRTCSKLLPSCKHCWQVWARARPAAAEKRRRLLNASNAPMMGTTVAPPGWLISG